jgi:thiol-disulfide isomerase/thioredoxin
VLAVPALTLLSVVAQASPCRSLETPDQILVLNFWASWCRPCRKEIPLLARIQQEYRPRGVQVVGASIDEAEDREAAERLARRLGAVYPLRFGCTTEEMKALRLGDSIPATAILDRDGTARFRLVGEVKEDLLRPRLDFLLGDRSSAAPAEVVLPPGLTVEHFRAHHESGGGDDHEHDTEGGSTVPT